MIISRLKTAKTAQLHIGRESAFFYQTIKNAFRSGKATELFELAQIINLSRVEEPKNVDESFVQWRQKTKQPRDPK